DIAPFRPGAKPSFLLATREIPKEFTRDIVMTVDYEVEYNNRARVPEHPEIFARWQREGAAYRAASHNAKLGISYGPSSRRTIDLFPARDDDKAPLAMFIHGGWWRSLEPASFSQIAAGGHPARGGWGGGGGCRVLALGA